MSESAKIEEVARELLTLASSKPYVFLERYSRKDGTKRFGIEEFDPDFEWYVSFPVQYSLTFFEFFDTTCQVAVALERQSVLIAEHPEISEPRWPNKENFAYIEVNLGGSLSIDFLIKLVDEAFELVWNAIGRRGQLFLHCEARPEDHRKLLDEWITAFDLDHRREDLQRIARSAVLLSTSEPDSERVPIGITKVGGEPDLPPNFVWPKYTNGKSLAFLAQINLADIANVSFSMDGLPRDGIMSVFSVWGWGNDDPEPPNEGEEIQDGWNIVVHHPQNQLSSLVRRKTPSDVNQFKVSYCEPYKFISLPNQDPCLEDLNLSDIESQRYFDMISEYESSFKTFIGPNCAQEMNCGHQIGGFGSFCHLVYPDDFENFDFRLIVIIGSDNNSEMYFGDGGALMFFTLTDSTSNFLERQIFCIYD